MIIIMLLLSEIKIHSDNLSQISIYINDKPYTATIEWIDSLQTDPEIAIIRYKITGALSDGKSVITRIRLPQVLTINEVVRQIVLYYKMLDNDEARKNEEILIFPYFTEPDDPPFLRVNYLNSHIINIKLREWQTVKRPPPPSPEERDIYNQIIEDSFNDVQEYGNISDETFIKIARENNIPLDRVTQIYKNVILWQLTR